MRPAVRASILALSLLAGPRRAHAQEESSAPQSLEAEAARIFAAGDQAYEAGKYLAAAGAYERAYKLHPVPAITFSIAQAYRRHYFESDDVASLLQAQALYKRYLDEQPSGGRRAHAVTHLGNIAVLLASRALPAEGATNPAAAAERTEILVASVTPGAYASIDGGPAQLIPVVQEVPKGPHRVVVTADGYADLELEIIASEGKLAVLPTELKPRPGALSVTSSVIGADVWVDGRRAASAPTDAALELAPGRHVVAVGAPGRDLFSRALELRPGERTALHAELETSRQRVAAYGMIGAAGGLALIGAALAGVAAAAESEALEAREALGEGRPMTPEEAARSNDALARRDLTRVLSGVSFGVSGLAGATGTLLFSIDTPRPSELSEAIAPSVGVGWVTSF